MKTRGLIVLMGIVLNTVSLFGAALTFTTSGAGDGTWDDPASWDQGLVPDSDDDVVIQHALTVDVTPSSIQSLVLSAAVTLTVDASQTLTVLGAITDNSGANLSIAGGLVANSIVFDASGISLTNDGVVSVTTSVSFTTGVFTNNGTLNVGANMLIDQANFTNTGTLDITGDLSIQNMNNVTNDLNIIVGGNFSINKGVLDNNGTIDIEGTGSFTNDPTIINSGGTLDFAGAVSYNATGGTFTNTGGTLYARSGLDFTGTVDAACPTDGNINYWGTLTKANCADELVGVNLPVELTRFYGEEVTSGVLLEWSTASEMVNDYFNIQYSVHGYHFVDIGRVKGNGTTSNGHEYTFVHSDVQKGVNYYRLQQTDFDGTATLSDIISVYVDDSNLLVYPNVVAQGTEIQVSGVEETKVVRVVSISSGAEIFVDCSNGIIQTASLARDSYRLQYILDGVVQTIPFTVY